MEKRYILEAARQMMRVHGESARLVALAHAKEQGKYEDRERWREVHAAICEIGSISAATKREPMRVE